MTRIYSFFFFLFFQVLLCAGSLTGSTYECNILAKLIVRIDNSYEDFEFLG